jgi:hypothetical protein
MTIDNELRTLAEEAVVYAFPLYEMSRMRAATSPQRTDIAGEALKPRRWCNVFTHARQLLGAGKSRVVAPNNDTLYTNAWLDLGDGPLVIDVPDTAGRYYVLGLLDFYTNPFAHIGQRLTGTAARSFLVTPPGWRGEVPAAFEQPGAHVEAPTRWLWIIGRILVDGPNDVPAVNALQDGFVVRTLGDWQAGKASSMPKHFDPACDPKAPLSAEHFAAQVNRALRENPPPASDAALLARFASLGLGPDVDALDDMQLAVLQDALDAVLPRLRGAQSGASGRKLNGSGCYTLRFAPGALPPVEAFWSLTMYDSRDYMLVDNPIDRYAIGDRTPDLRRDADGGLTLHIQHARPEGQAAQANWLPAPAGDFYLCLRAYVPREEMLDGRYALPALVRIEEAA